MANLGQKGKRQSSASTHEVDKQGGKTTRVFIACDPFRTAREYVLGFSY